MGSKQSSLTPEQEEKLPIVKIFSSYGAYHNNPVNIGIHIICIPLIVWSLIGMGESFPITKNYTLPIVKLHPTIEDPNKMLERKNKDSTTPVFHFRHFIIFIVTPFLLHLIVPLTYDFFTGLCNAAMYFVMPLCYVQLNAPLIHLSFLGLLMTMPYAKKLFGDKAFFVFAGAHIVSWLVQFYGHFKFEKRRPALMDNLTQVFTAPFFVCLEVLFALGYKPWLKKACERVVQKNLAQWKAKKN